MAVVNAIERGIETFHDAPWKSTIPQRVRIPPGKLSLQPAAIGADDGGNDIVSIPLAVAVGAPLHLDGYAALPLVRGLMESCTFASAHSRRL